MEVKFHDIGEGMSEGEILNYFVNVGDEVKVDQPLVEMQTDKMVAEIPSPTAGTIQEIYFKTGETIHVGTVIMKISSGKEAPIEEEKDEEDVLKKSSILQPGEKTVSVNRSQRILAAPYTRKIARENGVDIEQIKGTGPTNRVTDDDVYQFINKGSAVIEDDKTSKESHVERVTEDIEEETIPFTGIRRQIAKKMSHSLQTIPHVTHFEEVDLTNIMEWRKELKEMGENISVVAFFIKAVAIALKDYPVFNAKLDEENEVIRLSKAYNIGLATDTKAGLLVPVMHHVEKKSIREVHNEMKALTKKAQDGKLEARDMKNGTFTISNVGPLGGMAATPIINHPETGIISFHKTKKVPVVMENDEIAIRSMMNLSFSFDHRVADGVLSVNFINRFVALIEEPKNLLLELV
ncbi:dihydrolipoamide acetyltransferase family protein [Oceanobacillus sp. CAU 1775]